MSSEISEVVSGQVNERFLEVPTNSTYFADLATLNAAQSGAQNPFDAVVREVVDLRAADGDMSAFDSRYKPLASDTLWIPAATFAPISNTPTVGTLGLGSGLDGRTTVMLYDASTGESASATSFCPPSWATYDVYLWWSNAGAGAGDVVWAVYRNDFGDGVTTNAGGTVNSLTATAPAQYVTKRSKVNSVAVSLTAGNILRLTVQRVATDAADTLANDAGMIGVELVRLS